MKSTVIITGIAALTVSGAAFAQHGHGYGHGQSHANRYAYDQCPHGLAKKHNGCLPPGQARKLARGDRWHSEYGTRYSYQRIPYDVRQQYALNSRYRYYYDNGYLYQVNPRTMLVQQVISALLR
jgi:hypothetical protein